MAFQTYKDARQFLLSELCYLAAESIHQDIGEDALRVAGKLLSLEDAATYREFHVGEYTYYVQRHVEPTG